MLIPQLGNQSEPKISATLLKCVLSGRGQQTWVYGAVWSKGFRRAHLPVSLLEELIQSIVGDVFEGRIRIRSPGEAPLQLIKMMPRYFKSLCGLLLAVAGSTSFATEPVKVVLEFEPDPANGRYLFEICARCHLPEAWGDNEGNYPQLAGQHTNVLMKQLLDIRSGRRDNPTMWPFVQERTIGGYQNLVDVVSYVATLPMNPHHSQGPWPQGTEEYKEGMQLYQTNCSSCHGAGGEGDNASYYPRLQGQHFSYMKRQAIRVRDGLREVDPAMAAVIKALSDEETDKVLNYISYLPVPAKDLAPSADWRNPDLE